MRYSSDHIIRSFAITLALGLGEGGLVAWLVMMSFCTEAATAGFW
jgi:hypothetical protein